jgi:general secretion pathway protein K
MRDASERGIALLVVIWVLTILMVIVFSFSFMTRTESQSTLAYKEGMERRFLAEAGIERGIMEVSYANLFRNQQVILEGKETWRTDGSLYKGELASGNYHVRITDESGKIDINALTDASGIIVKNLLMNAGVKEADADTIVDSILDWKDPDDLHRLNGAEDDYYSSLPTPYLAKDANFDTVEELILVKGVTPEILYGTESGKGIIEFLTVNGKSPRINVLAAPLEVLVAIPGITPEVADDIISKRESIEGQATPAIVLPPESLPFAAVGGVGTTFTIESVGRKGTEKGGYAVRATVAIEQNNKVKYLYYKSPATVRE